MKVVTEEMNIWDDPAAASFVRSVNAGDETVPTLVIGDATLVNPTLREVRRLLARLPHARDAH
jgi:hypothetical protein